jgi:p-hydroxybenzoate 3-monooxygenase
LNLAASDVGHLARGFAELYRDKSAAGIDAYSDRCLRRIWKAERFSWWLTSLMHKFPEMGDFGQHAARRARVPGGVRRGIDRALAENYVGLPLEH